MNTTTLKLPAATLVSNEAKTSFRDYLELTKPRLSLLSVATAVVGYFSTKGAYDSRVFISMLIGTSLCAGGVAALNQWMESDTDALMKRTADRPIPSGRVTTGSAFVLGWFLCAGGLALLFAQTGGLPASMALATIVSYLAVYTPAKRWSRWSTEIGAVAGAFPPLIGWAASANPVGAMGWILFGILFFWQIPHFMAIAWRYRRDYEAVHFPMLAVRDEKGTKVAAWSLVACVAAVGSAAVPSFLGLCGMGYFVTTVLLGLWFVGCAIKFLSTADREPAAKKLFFASIGWLPLQLVALVIARGW
jgi:protoheme IX farnesyltransferase